MSFLLFVTLCGLPGSGKSTVLQLLKESSASREIVLIAESVDDRRPVGCVDSSEAWHRARNDTLQSLRAAGKAADRSKRTVLLLDDTSLARSERRAVLVAASELGAAFAVLCCDAPLDECARQNSQRSGDARVPDDVFRRQAKRREPVTASWEASRCVRVDTTTTVDVNAVWTDLVACCDNPPLSAADRAKEQAQQSADRLESIRNRSHQRELMLRRLISTAMRADGLERTEKAKLAKILAQWKKNIKKELDECDNIVQNRRECEEEEGAHPEEEQEIQQRLEQFIHECKMS